MTDGLYGVTTDKFCAAFEIRGGEVVRCAPVLRRSLTYWMTKARRIEEMPEPTPGYLFTGDRHWGDTYIVDLIMSGLAWHQRMHGERIAIIEGEAKGLDIIARQCAERVELEVRDYPAQWDKYGKSAGPIRNRQMLNDEFVKVAFAFHDHLDESQGTIDMIMQCIDRGIPVYRIESFPRVN